MNILGIDPGKSGGIALVSEDRRVLHLDRIPTVRTVKSKREYDVPTLVSTLAHLKARYGIGLAVIERTHAMPGQGVSTMWTMGMGYGLVVGVVSALGIPLELADPAAWKRAMIGAAPDPKARKGMAILAAGRLFPGTTFAKTEHDLAEALLLAEWGHRRLSPSNAPF